MVNINIGVPRSRIFIIYLSFSLNPLPSVRTTQSYPNSDCPATPSSYAPSTTPEDIYQDNSSFSQTDETKYR